MIKKIHFTNESKSTSTEKETFEFAPSVQSDLFEYLKPHQKAALKPYLRLIKRPYQEKLCISLLDYLEGHGLDTLSEPILNRMQTHIIEDCRLHPLTSREPKSLGTIIRQFLAGFNIPLSQNSNLSTL